MHVEVGWKVTCTYGEGMLCIDGIYGDVRVSPICYRYELGALSADPVDRCLSSVTQIAEP